MKKSLFLTISLCFTIAVYAANENTTNGARAAAMGGTSVCFTDLWAVNNNQAGIANLKNPMAGFYIENRFLLKELTSKSLAFVLPTASGVFGLNYHHFGFAAYNEQKIALAYGRNLGKNFSIGLNLDYFLTAMGDIYGSKSAFTFEIGIISKLTHEMSLAFNLFNPVNAKFNDYNNEKIPSVFKLGLSYVFSDKLLFAVETEKNINFDAVFKAGIEYKILAIAYARLGISSNIAMNTFGFGLEYGQFKIDFASSIHQTLGYSPQFSIIYNFK